MSTTFCCFELGGSSKKKTRQRTERASIRNNASEMNTTNLTMSTYGNGRALSERRSVNFGGSLWRSQFEGKEAFRDLLGGIQRPLYTTTLSMGGSNDGGGTEAYQSMLNHSQTSPRGIPHSPSTLNASVPHMYECIQKFFRFQCQKCKKIFKRVITNEIANALVNIEETLNQQQNGQCSKCQSSTCNLLDVQTLLAGYAGEQRSTLKDVMDEEEDDFLEINVQMGDRPVNMRETEPRFTEPKVTAQFAEQVEGGQVDHEEVKQEVRNDDIPHTQNEGGEPIATGQDQDQSINAMKQIEASVPNTLIQSYFPNNAEKQRLNGEGENSYSPEGLIAANGEAQDANQIAQNNQRISIVAQSYQIKKQNTKQAIDGQAANAIGKGKDGGEYFQFDGDESTTNITAKVSNFQSKLACQASQKKVASPTSNSGNNIFNQKPDEDACRKFNSDLMSSLVARKMSKNKTFFEIKMLQQSQIHQGLGHLHGISGAVNHTSFNPGPGGHFSTQQPNAARPHISTAQNAAGRQRQTQNPLNAANHRLNTQQFI